MAITDDFYVITPMQLLQPTSKTMANFPYPHIF
jgi:hypothetical protein